MEDGATVIDAHTPRGDHEFVFVAPPGFVDLSSDEKAAEAPLLLVRESHDGDERFRFFAIAAPPARATITAVVVVGRMPIAPNSIDRLRSRLAAADQQAFPRGEIVTLSQTQAVRLELARDGLHAIRHYVPGRLRTAIIDCRCAGDELERYEPLFVAFAANAARGAETALPTWQEIERDRKEDPRRQGLSLKLGAWVMGFGIAGGVVGALLDLSFELALVTGAFVGMIAATIWGVRGGAPTLPGGGGDED